MILPFEAALGPDAARASPAVREHFLQKEGTRRWRGTMTRVWRARGWRGLLAAPAVAASRRAGILFRETGTDVGFEVENVVTAHPDGRARMRWTRTFRFPEATRVFDAVMVYDPARDLIDDRLGSDGALEVELVPRVDEGAIVVRSGRQWLRLGGMRLRIPALAAGRASIREWAEPDGRLGVRVLVSNPLLGEIFGYEGTFERAP